MLDWYSIVLNCACYSRTAGLKEPDDSSRLTNNLENKLPVMPLLPLPELHQVRDPSARSRVDEEWSPHSKVALSL